jgi:hypothetical protein
LRYFTLDGTDHASHNLMAWGRIYANDGSMTPGIVAPGAGLGN